MTYRYVRNTYRYVRIRTFVLGYFQSILTAHTCLYVRVHTGMYSIHTDTNRYVRKKTACPSWDWKFLQVFHPWYVGILVYSYVSVHIRTYLYVYVCVACLYVSFCTHAIMCGYKGPHRGFGRLANNLMPPYRKLYHCWGTQALVTSLVLPWPVQSCTPLQCWFVAGV